MDATKRKALVDGEKEGNLLERVESIWGADGPHVFRMGERSAWKHAHRAVRLKLVMSFVGGVGFCELLRALL